MVIAAMGNGEDNVENCDCCWRELGLLRFAPRVRYVVMSKGPFADSSFYALRPFRGALSASHDDVVPA